IDKDMNPFDSIFDRFLNMDRCPEIFYLRENIRNWRFYDYFRTDKDAPARQSQIGTFTPILNHDGSDVAAAIQTVMENGIMENLVSTIEDAFPGARLEVQAEQGRFSLFFHQPGLLRPLTVSELSEGTLRYILLVAALLTPRPPELMVLNEPETSLHPDLIPALARLIIKASKESQIWVISHSKVLIKQLTKYKHCKHLELEKELGATLLKGQNLLDKPQWKWPVKS
ncbi:MAG: AAA family ATPase, partial [Lentisphaeria bacterium]|nr:AAA family ATPase [Lentisphaeria bacterium]NQZ66811.1 AAA family ATPase [Lentisphaeria bacterium]